MTRYYFFVCFLLAGMKFSIAQADVGIGIGHSGLFPTVASVQPGSPAALAGVPLNGAIMRIDSKDGFGMKAKDAKKYLQGEAGSQLIIIVTSINRTDTFKLIRQKKGRVISEGDQVLCRELSDVFLQLQIDAGALKGKVHSDSAWISLKQLSGARQSIIEESTLSGTAPWSFRAILAEADDQADLSPIQQAYDRFLPLLDACLRDWKRKEKPDPSYITETSRVTYEKGNIIVTLVFNDTGGGNGSAAYSLDLSILSLK